MPLTNRSATSTTRFTPTGGTPILLSSKKRTVPEGKQAFKVRPKGAKIVQVRAKPSLLELCRAQPILCNKRIAQGIALGYALVGLSARSQDRTRRSRLTRSKSPVPLLPPSCHPFVTLLLFLFPAPLIYVYFPLEKSFNPSAYPSFSLILRGKVAEGFGFQTLQEVSAVQVAFSTHAVFGPS